MTFKLSSLKSWKASLKKNALNTIIFPPCWKIFQKYFYALFLQCRPGSHLLSVKTYSYTLFSRFKSEKRETKKPKNQSKKENGFFFTCNRQVNLQNHLKGKHLFSLKMYYQKKIAIIIHCIENQQKKYYFFALDQIRGWRRATKRPMKYNLNKNLWFDHQWTG